MPEHIDLDALADYLDSDESPEDCMGLSDLDGFLTGIIIGPELILPSEWLPVIWGHEEPEFESTAQAETIISLIMGRYNEIATSFNADPEKFEPIFYKWPTDEVIASDWASGFLGAVALRPKAWKQLKEHRRDGLLMAPLFILGGPKHHGGRISAADEQKLSSEMPDIIQSSILGVRQFWRNRQDRSQSTTRKARKPKR